MNTWTDHRFDARWWGLIALAVLSLAAWSWWRDARQRVTVESKTWRFEIEVEQRRAESESQWCDELPAGTVVRERRAASSPEGGERERCQITSAAWRTRWLARAEGHASEPPRWPDPHLKPGTADGLGAERLGKRQAFFELRLRKDADEAWTCAMPRADWERWQIGMRPRLEVDRFGVAHCAELMPPSP